MSGFNWIVDWMILHTHITPLIFFTAAVMAIIATAAYLVKKETGSDDDT